ncbi:DUF72 domain-containing protein [Mucilaginibacter corticis]|uniref:DUF72 domain-containing protein n=2 Tax=Mucilaginibacter corticis TaxID=2597670 RepID=A0A556MMF4_9SPHI|nr:DUF72 domain-containing protein [Mucilaginibacter corticis]
MPKRDFPPHQAHLSRLGFYARQENSIEINSSFYHLPQPKTVKRWSEEVTENFRFTFKLWKEITHRKNLIFKAEDVTRFKEAIAVPKAHRGCLLVQLPPGLQSAALPQLQELLLVLGNDWPVAVEFRHNSWYKDEVYEILFRANATMVLQDFPKTVTPVELTSDELVYLRFHGPSGNYKGSYTEYFLYEYAAYIHEWLQEGRSVYCYFNNTAGDALGNLCSLKQMVSELS